MTESFSADADFLLRNAVESLPQGALERRLEQGRPLRIKFGIDPTVPDVHLGHAVPLAKLREFQDLGHLVVLIIGDYTARVGDPSGRSAIRPRLEPGEIDANAETYRRQAFRILDPERTELRHNSEWLDMAMEDLFGLARTATVAQLRERDDFARHYSAGEPISVLELLYPLLQGYDSVAVRADVEIGGTDQTFNLLLGREVQTAYGLEPQAILAMPILPGIDGERRMSKSLDNYVGLEEEPDEIFGKLMRVPDGAMGLYYNLLLGGPPDPAPAPVAQKRALARDLTARFHGPDAAEAAEARFDRLHVHREAPVEVEEAELPSGEDPVHVPALIAACFEVSRAQARRLLAQGGVRLDGEPLGADELDVAAPRLEGAVLALGKRRFVRLRAAGAAAPGPRPSDDPQGKPEDPSAPGIAPAQR